MLLVQRVQLPGVHRACCTIVDAVLSAKRSVAVGDTHRHAVATRTERQDTFRFPCMELQPLELHLFQLFDSERTREPCWRLVDSLHPKELLPGGCGKSLRPVYGELEDCLVEWRDQDAAPEPVFCKRMRCKIRLFLDVYPSVPASSFRAAVLAFFIKGARQTIVPLLILVAPVVPELDGLCRGQTMQEI